MVEKSPLHQQDEFNRLIQTSRSLGNIEDAIEYCQKAIDTFPRNSFYYKILGDIHMQSKCFSDAIACYVNYLKYIDSLVWFKNFVKHFRHFEKVAPVSGIEKYRSILHDGITANKFSVEITNLLVDFLNISTVPIAPNSEVFDLLSSSNDDSNFKIIVEKIQYFEKTTKALSLLHY